MDEPRRADQRRGGSAGRGALRPLTRYRAARAMRGVVLRVGVAVAVLLSVPAFAHAAPTRYSLQGGCYGLQDGSGQSIAGGEQIRMQATGLGSYLLYRPDTT